MDGFVKEYSNDVKNMLWNKKNCSCSHTHKITILSPKNIGGLPLVIIQTFYKQEVLVTLPTIFILRHIVLKMKVFLDLNF
jgi:hypothetical protein